MKKPIAELAAEGRSFTMRVLVGGLVFAILTAGCTRASSPDRTGRPS